MCYWGFNEEGGFIFFFDDGKIFYILGNYDVNV